MVIQGYGIRFVIVKGKSLQKEVFCPLNDGNCLQITQNRGMVLDLSGVLPEFMNSR